MFKPKEGQQFWFLNMEWKDSPNEYPPTIKIDSDFGWVKAFGKVGYNCFQTRKEAEQAKKKIIQVLKGQL